MKLCTKTFTGTTGKLYIYTIKTCYMKYHTGQEVTLLDTQYKPAGKAIVCHYEKHSDKYEVDFIYPDKEKADKISVPEDRLRLLTDFTHL